MFPLIEKLGLISASLIYSISCLKFLSRQQWRSYLSWIIKTQNKTKINKVSNSWQNIYLNIILHGELQLKKWFPLRWQHHPPPSRAWGHPPSHPPSLPDCQWRDPNEVAMVSPTVPHGTCNKPNTYHKINSITNTKLLY